LAGKPLVNRLERAPRFDVALLRHQEPCGASGYAVTKTLRFLEIGSVKAAFDDLLVQNLTHIWRNTDTNIPAITATTFAAPVLQIGYVCQWGLPHNRHPLSNIPPQQSIESVLWRKRPNLTSALMWELPVGSVGAFAP
jgi:hypothetical protein